MTLLTSNPHTIHPFLSVQLNVFNCNHHHNHFQSIFITPERNPEHISSPSHFLPPSHSWLQATTDVFSRWAYSVIYMTFCVCEVIQYTAFCFWLVSCSIFLRFIHVDCTNTSFFLLPSNISLYVYATFYSSSHQLIDICMLSTSDYYE